MPTERIAIPAGELELDAALDTPDNGPPAAIVVICHPHPQYGGDMENNVVVAIADGLVRDGIAALRFNFRGVGISEGTYDGGAGEQDDARAAIQYARSLVGISRVGLAGYSFGSGVAAAVAVESIAAL